MNNYKYLGILEPLPNKHLGKWLKTHTPAYECQICTAVITNPERHTDWHANWHARPQQTTEEILNSIVLDLKKEADQKAKHNKHGE